jgi:charged multivesicular body protein 3
MAMMNTLVKLPQLNSTMMAMAREMEKAGLIEEVMNDVLDNDAELDEEADQELDKVIDEVVMGLKTTNAPKESLPSASKAKDSDSEEEDDLEKRLTQLKQ